MERHKVTAGQAFAVLVRASRDRDVELRDIADALVVHGGLPEGRRLRCSLRERATGMCCPRTGELLQGQGRARCSGAAPPTVATSDGA